MRRSIFLAVIILSTNCYGQSKYFNPGNIVDKTEELKNNHVDWTSLKDRESIDGYTRIGDSIFGGEIACNVKPLKHIDVSTFQVCPGTKYARDKNHVYYPLETYCVDYDDCGVCFYIKVIVENAKPSSFKALGRDYGTDGRSTYFRGKIMKEADGETFRVVENSEDLYFAKDKKHVYLFNKIFENADPATFKIHTRNLSDSAREFEEKYILSDQNSEWQFSPPNEIIKVK